MTSRWPKDNQTDLIRFYGKPKTKQLEDQLVRIKPPFKLYFDKKPVDGLLVHGKCASAFMGAFQKIWDYYDRDQATIDRLGISEYAGAYNPRLIRGSKTKWSNHAYGAAIDLYASKNGMGTGRGKMPLPVVAAFKSEGARWGGDYRGRTDPMHFEFCDGGDPQRTFEGWLAHYAVQKTPALVSKRPLHNKEGDLIKATQQRLQNMGYHEVGEIDGKWGGRTQGAIAAFKNDRKLADASLGISKALLAEMDDAEAEVPPFKRPIAVARSEATTSEIAEEAPELVPAESGKNIAVAASGASATVGFVSAVGDNFNTTLPWIETIRGFFDNVPGPVWFALAAVFALGLAWYFRRASKGIKAAYRTGKRN
jgi:peptidoglycan hydrolase-like protein with peptidoglycan-binding domain